MGLMKEVFQASLYHLDKGPNNGLSKDYYEKSHKTHTMMGQLVDVITSEKDRKMDELAPSAFDRMSKYYQELEIPLPFNRQDLVSIGTSAVVAIAGTSGATL